MKIGFVCPQEVVDDILPYLRKKFPKDTFVSVSYPTISAIPEILSGKQSRADAFLFLGETALHFTMRQMHLSAPFFLIHRTTASLLRILVHAALDGYSMRIVTDCIQKDLFETALQDASPEEIELITMPSFPYSDKLLRTDARELARIVENGEADFAVTMYYKVYAILKKQGTPAFYLRPSLEDIRNAVHQLILTRELTPESEGGTAVLAVWMEDTEKNNDINEQEVRKLPAYRYIYRFASAIHGACLHSKNGTFYIFAPYNELSMVTRRFHELPFVKELKTVTGFTASAGIGFGVNPMDACSHADEAMKIAGEKKNDRVYLIGADGKEVSLSGDRSMVPPKKDKDEPKERFERMARTYGVTPLLLERLRHICEEEERTEFTSKELADFTGITPRTMNRIILRMEDAGLCEERGKKYSATGGRPSRVIRLLIKEDK